MVKLRPDRQADNGKLYLVRLLALFLLLFGPLSQAAKPGSGEVVDYLCIGQGVDPKGHKSASAEARVKVRLPAGKRFDKIKEPTPATVTLSNLMLHDTRGNTKRMGRLTFRGKFEVGKEPPREGHNFDAKIPRGETVREIHINLSNSQRSPSSLRVANNGKVTEHFMLCQWE